MAKLQKPDRQQRRQSRPPIAPSDGSSVTTSATGRADPKRRATSCPPTPSYHVAAVKEPFSQSVEVEAHHPEVNMFEHSPQAPEPSFVALGREMFLRRANIISQTYANKFKNEGGNTAEPKEVFGMKDPSTAGPSRKSQRFPGLRYRDPPTSFRALANLEDKASAASTLLTQQSEKEQLVAQSLTPKQQRSSKIRIISRKRSQSLPATGIPRTDTCDLSQASSSSSQERMPPPRRGSAQSSKQQGLPFTPKVDLEKVLDIVSTSYNEQLADAQRRSAMLWKKSSEEPPASPREPTVLKKRQRRLTSPAVATPPLALPYDAMRPGAEPEMVGSLKDELPSQKTSHSGTEKDLPDGRHAEQGISTSQAASTSSLTRNENNYQAPQNAGVVLSSNDCHACPHCGHRKDADDSSNKSSTSLIERSVNQSPSMQVGSSSNRQRKRPTTLPATPRQPHTYQQPPLTPTELSISDRLQATRALLLAASNRERENNPQPKAIKSRFHMRSNTVSESPRLQKSTSADAGDEYNMGSPGQRKDSLGEQSQAGSQAESTYFDTVDYQSDSWVSAQSLYRYDRGPSDIYPSQASHASYDQHETQAADLQKSDHSAQQLTMIAKTQSLSSSASSLSSLASPHSRPTSFDQTGCTTAPASPSKLSFVRVNSNEYIRHAPRTSSASPSRGILTISPSIIPLPALADVHPALRSEYIMAHDAASKTTLSLVQDEGWFQSPVSDLVPPALNISRSSKLSSLSTVRAREQSQDRSEVTPTITGPVPFKDKKVESKFTELDIKPREGTQSLLQFQRNCRQVPLSPIQSEFGDSLKVGMEVEENATPSSRDKSHLTREPSKRNRLQKPRPDPQQESVSRGRRRSRYSQPPVPPQAPPCVVAGDNPKKDTDLTHGQINKTDTLITVVSEPVGNNTTVPPYANKENRKPRPPLPPTSFVSSHRGRNESGSRSTSRGRSRIRSILQSVGLVSKDTPDEMETESTNHQTEVRTSVDQTTTTAIHDVNEFKSSGPYEQIRDVTTAAESTSGKGLRRRGRFRERDLKVHQKTVTAT